LLSPSAASPPTHISIEIINQIPNLLQSNHPLPRELIVLVQLWLLGLLLKSKDGQNYICCQLSVLLSCMKWSESALVSFASYKTILPKMH
jgi:hypothetical protein